MQNENTDTKPIADAVADNQVTNATKEYISSFLKPCAVCKQSLTWHFMQNENTDTKPAADAVADNKVTNVTKRIHIFLS